MEGQNLKTFSPKISTKLHSLKKKFHQKRLKTFFGVFNHL
jgi:hypothetical protein